MNKDLLFKYSNQITDINRNIGVVALFKRIHFIRFKVFMLAWSVFTLKLYAQNQVAPKQIDQISIYSKILDEKRTCLIAMPEGYNKHAQDDQSFPIIILLDGSVYFETVSSTVNFMSSSKNRNYLMEASFVVAIENVDRERDFTVTKIKTKRPNRMGGGRNFIQFIEKELLPYLDKHYKTNKDRTFIGHSLGGLLLLNVYMDKDNMFNKYLCIDPSIWWDPQTMKRKVSAMHSKSFKKRILIATANQGKKNYTKNKLRHDKLVLLIKKMSRGQASIQSKYFEDEDHRSVVLKAVYDGLKFLNTSK